MIIFLIRIIQFAKLLSFSDMTNKNYLFFIFLVRRFMLFHEKVLNLHLELCLERYIPK